MQIFHTLGPNLLVKKYWSLKKNLAQGGTILSAMQGHSTLYREHKNVEEQSPLIPPLGQN